jgi:hypothetical protein
MKTIQATAKPDKPAAAKTVNEFSMTRPIPTNVPQT